MKNKKSCLFFLSNTTDHQSNIHFILLSWYIVRLFIHRCLMKRNYSYEWLITIGYITNHKFITTITKILLDKPYLIIHLILCWIIDSYNSRNASIIFPSFFFCSKIASSIIKISILVVIQFFFTHSSNQYFR